MAIQMGIVEQDLIKKKVVVSSLKNGCLLRRSDKIDNVPEFIKDSLPKVSDEFCYNALFILSMPVLTFVKQ
jgi:hypothetical protein